MAGKNKSIAGRMMKTAARKGWIRFMDRGGSKVVAGFADTSSDAPDAHYAPKRNLYAQMQQQELDGAESQGDGEDSA